MMGWRPFRLPEMEKSVKWSEQPRTKIWTGEDAEALLSGEKVAPTREVGVEVKFMADRVKRKLRRRKKR